MKMINALTSVGIILAGMLPLAAQEQGWQAGGSLALPVGTARSSMGLDAGIHVSGAYVFGTSMGYSLRPGASLGYFHGKGVTGIRSDADSIIQDDPTLPPSAHEAEGSSVTHTLIQAQVFSDLLVPVTDKTQFVIGLSLNRYTVKFSGGSSATGSTPGAYSPVGLDAAHYDNDGVGGLVRSGDPNGSASVPGIKFGLRIGFEYAYTKTLSAHGLFQLTELGRMVSTPSAVPTVNPAWFDFGVTYRF